MDKIDEIAQALSKLKCTDCPCKDDCINDNRDEDIECRAFITEWLQKHFKEVKKK